MKFDWRASLLAVLFIALWIFGWVEQQSVVLFTVYSLTPFVLYALLLSVYPYSRIEIKTEIVETKVPGQRVIRQTYHRNNRFPLFYLRGIEVWKSQKVTIRKSYAFYIGFRKEWKVEYSLEDLTRGHYCLYGVTWEAHDLFHMIRKKTKASATASFYIYPYVNTIYLRHLQREQYVLTEGSKYEQSRQLQGTDLSTLRTYVRGDSLKDIHWKKSAKQGEFVTKQYEEPVHTPITIGIDFYSAYCFEERLSFAMTSLYYFYAQGIPFTYQSLQETNEKIYVNDAISYERVRRLLAMATISDSRMTADALQRVDGMLLITSMREASFYRSASNLNLFIYVVAKEKPKKFQQVSYISIREEEKS